MRNRMINPLRILVFLYKYVNTRGETPNYPPKRNMPKRFKTSRIDKKFQKSKTFVNS